MTYGSSNYGYAKYGGGAFSPVPTRAGDVLLAPPPSPWGGARIKVVATGSEDDGNVVSSSFRIRTSFVQSLRLLPDETRLVLMRGSIWFPDIPGRGAPPAPHTVGKIIGDPVYLASTVFRDGDIEHDVGYITHMDTAPVPMNSVLYVRCFICRPGGEWEVYGAGWGVMPGYYGGESAARDALPVTFYTGGDPYGYIDPASPTAVFASAPGFLSDLITTDGSLMTEGPERLHPAMVLPMLKGLGTTQEEVSALLDPVLSGRAKNLLYATRNLQMATGTAASVAELCRVLTGYPAEVVLPVENLLATLGDSSPRGVELDAVGDSVGNGFTVVGDWFPYDTATTDMGDEHFPDYWYAPLNTDMWLGTTGHTPDPDGSWEEKQGVRSPWMDTEADLWLPRWDQVPIEGDSDLLGTVNGQLTQVGLCSELPHCPVTPWDDWAERSYGYETLVDVVHGFNFDTVNNRPATIQSKRTSTANMEPLTTPGGYYRLRLKVSATLTSENIKVHPRLVFLDEAGNLLRRYPLAATDGASLDPGVAVLPDPGDAVSPLVWTKVESPLFRAPDKAAYIGWEVECRGTGTVFLGAIELRDLTPFYTSDPRHEFDGTATMDQRDDLWDDNWPTTWNGITFDATSDQNLDENLAQVYHNPRSVLIVLHSPPVKDELLPANNKFNDTAIAFNAGETGFNEDVGGSYVPSSFDSTKIMMDAVVPLNQTDDPVFAPVTAADGRALEALRHLIPDYLPHSVTHRVLPSWEGEYLKRFRGSRPPVPDGGYLRPLETL